MTVTRYILGARYKLGAHCICMSHKTFKNLKVLCNPQKMSYKSVLNMFLYEITEKPCKNIQKAYKW